MRCTASRRLRDAALDTNRPKISRLCRTPAALPRTALAWRARLLQVEAYALKSPSEARARWLGKCTLAQAQGGKVARPVPHICAPCARQIFQAGSIFRQCVGGA